MEAGIIAPFASVSIWMTNLIKLFFVTQRLKYIDSDPTVYELFFLIM
jgi:hypothetical protein